MKKITSLLISSVILGIVFYKIDIPEFLRHMRQMHIVWFALSLIMFVPQTLVSAMRWRVISSRLCHISLGESVKLILAGNTLNLILPSKMGDIAKAYFLNKEGKLELSGGLHIVVFEKVMDVVSLSLVMLMGILAARLTDYMGLVIALFGIGILSLGALIYFANITNSQIYRWFVHRFLCKIVGEKLSLMFDNVLSHASALGVEFKKHRLLMPIVSLSIFLWVFHLVQFVCFFFALRAGVPVFQIFALVPVAIFIGLMPMTIGGIGTRDAALIYLFSPYAPASLIAGIGIFATMRYIVPGLLGLPFFNQYAVGKQVRSN